ncbi:hypothetical protein [Microlunatus ginsengisoli]
MSVDVTVQRSVAAIMQALQNASVDGAEAFAGEYRACVAAGHIHPRPLRV